jgi:energy-coupling factor transporter ATP-binding protein EcfA2
MGVSTHNHPQEQEMDLLTEEMLNKLSSEDIKEIIIAEVDRKHTAEIEDKKIVMEDKKIEMARVISGMSPEVLQIYLAQDRNGKKS